LEKSETGCSTGALTNREDENGPTRLFDRQQQTNPAAQLHHLSIITAARNRPHLAAFVGQFYPQPALAQNTASGARLRRKGNGLGDASSNLIPDTAVFNDASVHNC
jgi:hypothetical protein